MPENNSHGRNLDDPVTWKEEGNEFFNKAQYEDAAKCYSHAIELNPNFIEAWNNLGLTLLKLGRVDQAKNCNEKVKELKESARESKPTQSTQPPSLSTQITTKTDNQLTIVQEQKNPGIAALCSFFIPGLGQIYNGDVGKGIAVLLGTLIGALFLFIPGLIVWIFGIYDAHKTSKRMNSGETQYKSTNTVAMILFGILGIVLILIFFIIVAAIIAAFTFGLAGSTPNAKNVAVTATSEGLTWQGGNDLSKIVSWTARLDDETVIARGDSAPRVGQGHRFSRPVGGERVRVIANFPDGSSEIILDVTITGTISATNYPTLNTQSSSFSGSNSGNQGYIPRFGWGDIIADRYNQRYVIYNENMETSGNYLVYRIGDCPNLKTIILTAVDVDKTYNKVGKQNPDTICSSNVIIQTTPTQTPITSSYTTVSTPQSSLLSCSISGKWIQQDVAGYVYIQIYSDKRIEIYLNNQLRSWGTWEIITSNQFRNTWTGGADTGTGNTVTISSDCNTHECVSFRGEHSTFIRA